jgi:hypothetical protein
MRKTGFGGHWVFAANDHHPCSLTAETDSGVLLKHYRRSDRDQTAPQSATRVSVFFLSFTAKITLTPLAEFGARSTRLSAPRD